MATIETPVRSREEHLTPVVTPTRNRFLRMGATLRDLLGYRAFLRAQGMDGRAAGEQEEQLNTELFGKPSNHRYSVHGGKLVPSFQLYERWRQIMRLLPARLDSFLDIGCCRGFYVLQAAQQWNCPLSIGIDVHEPSVAVAEKASRQLGLEGATFHTDTLEAFTQHAATHGGPFQVCLLIGTYHYVFWGSNYCRVGLRSHEKILACLAELTAERLILSGRLDLARLPRSVKEWACPSPEASLYNTDSFLRAAEPLFDIRQAGFLGGYPLLVMDKKGR